MAVELCKVSLWINAAVADQKLSFLDHHIKCGNSLVGAFRRLVAKGIPSEAYGGVTGDDKELAKAIRQKNEREQAGQLSVFRVVESKVVTLQDWAEVTRLAESDPFTAEQRYRALIARSGESGERLALDLWTAAFFWPVPIEENQSLAERARAGITQRKGERQTPLPPSYQDINQALAAPRLVNERVKALAHELRDAQRFFHWELEFPEVFGADGTGGFDIVLGNPPWERIKLQEKEFFAVHSPEIANVSSAAVRKQKILDLSQTNSTLYEFFSRTLVKSERISKFTRISLRYPLTGQGDVNTYALFAEHGFNILSKNGHLGIIVETGIATQDTYKDFFQRLVKEKNLISLLDFENGKKIFPDVQGNMKFCLLTLSKAPSFQVKIGAQLRRVEDVDKEDRIYELLPDDLALLNPNTLTLPTIKNKKDVNIVIKIHKNTPILHQDNVMTNKWGVSFGGMFHMTNDAPLFRTLEDFDLSQSQVNGNVIVTLNSSWLPLYESKYIAHFNHRHATFEGVSRSENSKSMQGQNSLALQIYRTQAGHRYPGIGFQ